MIFQNFGKQSKKFKILVLLLGLVLVGNLMNSTSFSLESTNSGNLLNFKVERVYTNNQFLDVTLSDWYSNDVKNTYELGLINGKSNLYFDPKGNLTLAEAVTIASNIHAKYHGINTAIETSGVNWYDGAVDYAIKNMIINTGEFPNMSDKATRAQMAGIFSRLLDSKDMTYINTVNTLPDVNATTAYSNSIYMLYNTGILSGSDSFGTFNPLSNVTRAETVAIIKRIVNKLERKVFTLQVKTDDIKPIFSNHTGGMHLIVVVDGLHESMVKSNLITADLELFDSNNRLVAKTSLTKSNYDSTQGYFNVYFAKTIKEGEKYSILLRTKSPYLNDFVYYNMNATLAVNKSISVNLTKEFVEDTNLKYLTGSKENPIVFFTSVGSLSKAIIIVAGELPGADVIGNIPLKIINGFTNAIIYGTADENGIFTVDLNPTSEDSLWIEIDSSKSNEKARSIVTISLDKNEYAENCYYLNIKNR